jgi:hypothetical protein
MIIMTNFLLFLNNQNEKNKGLKYYLLMSNIVSFDLRNYQNLNCRLLMYS